MNSVEERIRQNQIASLMVASSLLKLLRCGMTSPKPAQNQPTKATPKQTQQNQPRTVLADRAELKPADQQYISAIERKDGTYLSVSPYIISYADDTMAERKDGPPMATFTLMSNEAWSKRDKIEQPTIEPFRALSSRCSHDHKTPGNTLLRTRFPIGAYLNILDANHVIVLRYQHGIMLMKNPPTWAAACTTIDSDDWSPSGPAQILLIYYCIVKKAKRSHSKQQHSLSLYYIEYDYVSTNIA
jgi:hypothetical protein